MSGPDHFYITKEVDLAQVVQLGYSLEFIAGYVYPNHEEGTVPFHRWFNPKTGDHIYIADILDVPELRQAGYQYEFVACYVPNKPTNSTVPFHRLCGGTDHIYIAGDRDISTVQAAGYKYEFIACYVFSNQIPGTIPFYRLYRPGEDSGPDWLRILETAGKVAEVTLAVIALIQGPGTNNNKPEE